MSYSGLRWRSGSHPTGEQYMYGYRTTRRAKAHRLGGGTVVAFFFTVEPGGVDEEE